MRLIDADAFEVVITKIPDGLDAESYIAGMDFILNKIDDAPTIKPEREKGEWSEAERKKSEVFYCSLCGGKAYYPWVGSRKDERKNECGYNFCPNCGARMGGDNVHVYKKDADYTDDIYAPNWTDIHSDLPDEPGEYFLTVESRQSGTRWVEKSYFNGKSFDHNYLANPIAWAEMPEPYQR